MNCRFCQTKIDNPFLSLGCSPLANSFLNKEDLLKAEFFYPLNVYVCHKCFLVQIKEFEKPKNIFSNYAYFSSYSKSWLDHCKRYTNKVIKRFGLTKSSFVVEIASNDGYLLQFFKDEKIPILGIEPAKNVVLKARRKGIPTNISFFNSTYAQKLIKKTGKADLLIANNVLAHNPDINDFIKAFKIILKPEGVITLEFPHLEELIKNNQFDTIYHEHFFYFSFNIVYKIFKFHGIEIFDVEEILTHGGSLRIFGKHIEDRSKKISPKIKNLLKSEEKTGLLNINTYYNFDEKVKKTKRKLLDCLIKLKNKNKKIIAYGAPAKGNTFLNYCGIRTDFLDYTVDLNPDKQNKYLPGTHIPIKDPGVIKRDKPDYILILPWNLRDEIIEQLRFIKKWGEDLLSRFLS